MPITDTHVLATLVAEMHKLERLGRPARDFLTTDGEKPDRDRRHEFDQQVQWTRARTREAWDAGWAHTFAALDALTPADLTREVRIGGHAMTAFEAIVRAVSHYGQHVGQMLLLARHLLGPAWKTPSIPRVR